MTAGWRTSHPGTTGELHGDVGVCAPAPNTTICDTAVLTVTAGAAPALTVTKSATPAVRWWWVARVRVHDHDQCGQWADDGGDQRQ